MLTMRPAPDLVEVWQGESDQAGVGCQVDVERRCPIGLKLVLGLKRRVDQRHASVVDDDVKAAELLHRGLNHAAKLFVIGDIALDAERPLGAVCCADLVHNRSNTISAEVSDDDTRSFICKQVRCGAAHAARRARDDRDLAVDRARERRQAAHGRIS